MKLKQKMMTNNSKKQKWGNRSREKLVVLLAWCVLNLSVSYPMHAQSILDFMPTIVGAVKDNNGNSLFVTDAQGQSCTLTPNQKIMLDLHNQTRLNGQRCGNSNLPAVSTLRWSCTIGSTAVSHSNEMQANGDLTHDGDNGSDGGSRLVSNGYIWNSWGENIAAGRTTANGTMAQWLDSASHCTNLMNPAYTEIGVAQDGSVGNYWTAVFANRP